MATVRVSNDLIVEAMQAQETRDALAAKAQQIASRAAQIAQGEDPAYDIDVRVESGTRPKGRPYSRVVADDLAQEWGTSNTERRRILGRAAE